MNKKQQIPSLETLEILAISDRPVFENLMNNIGLKIEGTVNDDPLERTAQIESISSIASEITEDIHDYIDVDKHLWDYKNMAEDYGYVVSFKN